MLQKRIRGFQTDLVACPTGVWLGWACARPLLFQRREPFQEGSKGNSGSIAKGHIAALAPNPCQNSQLVLWHKGQAVPWNGPAEINSELVLVAAHGNLLPIGPGDHIGIDSLWLFFQRRKIRRERGLGSVEEFEKTVRYQTG